MNRALPTTAPERHAAATLVSRDAMSAEYDRLMQAGFAQAEAARWADDAGEDAYHAELNRQGA